MVCGNLVMTPLAGVGEWMRADPKQKYLIKMCFTEGHRGLHAELKHRTTKARAAV